MTQERTTSAQWRAGKAKAKGVRRIPGTMNKTEAAYDAHLGRQPSVVWHRYEGVTLRLGPDCRYTPDFIVMLHDGTLELHETKGFKRDDAMVKLRVVAEMFPFRVYLVERDGPIGWKQTEI